MGSQPCRDFMNGRCVRGDQCRFKHEEEGAGDNGGGDERGPPPPPLTQADLGDTDRMAMLFKEAGVTNIAEYNSRQKAAGVGLARDERQSRAPPPPTQAELDEILPLLEPLPEAYRQAFLAIPGCHQHLDTRHIKTILRLNPKHAMAALHEFREAMEDISSSIRNKGGYMMGVLRKYLPGEVASGVTYDGTAVSELEQSMADTDTFADPWKKMMQDEELAKLARELEAAELQRLKLAADKLRKSPLLPADYAQVKKFIKRKLKEAHKARPNLDVMHAWGHVEAVEAHEDDAWHGGASGHAFSALPSGGALRPHQESEYPLVFSTCQVPRSLPALVSVLEKPRHCTLQYDVHTAATHVAHRYDKRTALVLERGAIAAPFQAPHDRAVVVAWRAAPTVAPGAWLKLRFSVQTPLAPEAQHSQRCAVPISAILLEPLEEAGGPRTRVTSWAIEDFPVDSPAWLVEAAPFRARRNAANFSARLSQWLYLDAQSPQDDLPESLPEEWFAEEAADASDEADLVKDD